jgi:hypothetical protein
MLDSDLNLIKHEIDSGLRLRESIKKVYPSFKKSQENMSKLKDILFQKYPELKDKTKIARIEHKIQKLQILKNEATDQEEINNIDIEISRLQAQLEDINDILS